MALKRSAENLAKQCLRRVDRDTIDKYITVAAVVV
jgi:hypothetical protein